jgi:16S rRNA (adenine1518-N6/adenine1519-N6)-dimethyltransferase
VKKKKHFGQHFLSNPGVIEKIVAALERLDTQKLRRGIEVGPGAGALTAALLARGFHITAIEIDQDMVAHLQTQHAEAIARGQLRILEGDFLSLDLSELKSESWSFACGNLPYNCGTEIVFRFLEDFANIESFGFMLQREVVEKFLGTPANKDSYGIPSVKFSLSCTLKEVFWIQAGSFSPPPRVESGFFAYKRQPHPLADPTQRGASYDQVSLLIEKAFGQRRKMIRNTLGSWTADFAERRPESLSAEDFLALLKLQP